MTEMTGVPIIPKCFSLLGPTSSPSSSGLLLSRQRILEAQYLAQTIAGLSSEGSLLTPLGRSILEQTFRSSRDAQPSSKTNSLDHSSDTTTAEQTFSSKVEGVMSRLEELTNEILNSFKGVLEAWIAHSDRNGCPLLHYHLQYENAPTSPGSIPQSTSSAVVCVVTVRLASAVKEYSEAQLAIEREVSSRYYCRQPLSWTSAQAAAFYFPPSAEADNDDDDDDDDNGGIADSGRTEFFAMLKNKIVHRSEDMSVIRKKRVRSPEASDGSLSGGVVLGSLRTSCSEPMQCSSKLFTRAKLVFQSLPDDGAHRNRRSRKGGADASQRNATSVAPRPIESLGVGLVGSYTIVAAGTAFLGGPQQQLCDDNVVEQTFPPAPLKKIESVPDIQESPSTLKLSLSANGFLRSLIRL